MIHYKDPIGKLKAKGYTTTDLRKEKVLSQSVVTYLNNDRYLNLKTIDKICQLLECKIEDIVEILPDKENNDIED
jgi:DNA-binding Xre family transcriptional regulator